MAARIIGNEEISAACDALVREGRKVTVAAVYGHEIVGMRGGGGTISQGIKLWMARATPPAVPHPMVLSEAAMAMFEAATKTVNGVLATSLQGLLKVTATEAQEQVAALVKGLETTQSELIEERDGILAIEKGREQEMERQEQVIASLSAQAQAQGEENLRKVGFLEGQLAQLGSQITTLEQRLVLAAALAQDQAVRISTLEASLAAAASSEPKEHAAQENLVLKPQSDRLKAAASRKR